MLISCGEKEMTEYQEQGKAEGRGRHDALRLPSLLSGQDPVNTRIQKKAGLQDVAEIP